MKKIILPLLVLSLLAVGCNKTPDYSQQLNSISQSLSNAYPQAPTPDKPLADALVGYQAVFLTNGQVYFGKYSTYNKDYSLLTDIYYLQNSNGLQTDINPTGNINLVKLGNEIHGPQDAMYIPMASVLFVENLKADGRVVQAINQDHQNTLK
jgi:hypothetical protein